MKDRILKKKEEGFTIIEVLIVLAIAGLIILIVFLAVPALQRNSRNTQRKNDVSSILGAVSEYASNNNGDFPETSEDGRDEIANITELSFYDETSEFIIAEGNRGAPENSQVVLVKGAVCDADNTATASNASSRNVVVLYRAESGSGGAFQTVCQAS